MEQTVAHMHCASLRFDVVYANQMLRAVVKEQEDLFAEITTVRGLHTTGGRLVSAQRIFDL
jgi:hypothetical protein